MPPRAPLTPTAIRAPASRFVASNSSGSIPPIRWRRWPPAASSETLADQQEFGSCHPKRRKCRRGQAAHSAIPLADSRRARLLADRRFRPLSCIGAGASDRGKAYTSATGIAKVLNDRGIPTIRGYRKATKERADAIR